VVPTNILPKPFGSAVRPVRPLPSREASMTVASERWDRGEVMNGEDVNVGRICGTRLGLRRRITWINISVEEIPSEKGNAVLVVPSHRIRLGVFELWLDGWGRNVRDWSEQKAMVPSVLEKRPLHLSSSFDYGVTIENGKGGSDIDQSQT
jgi:hypothetical protein